MKKHIPEIATFKLHENADCTAFSVNSQDVTTCLQLIPFSLKSILTSITSSEDSGKATFKFACSVDEYFAKLAGPSLHSSNTIVL